MDIRRSADRRTVADAPRTERLARLLQERREAAGYSRARLGKIVGVSAGTIEGWELGRVGRPPFHEVMRIAAFLRIPLEDIQRAVFADAGAIPDPDEHPGPARTEEGRQEEAPRRSAAARGRLPALRLAGRGRGGGGAGRRHPNRFAPGGAGRERMDVADYMALTTTVNVGLVDAMRAGKTRDFDVAGAAEALGVRPPART